MSINSWCYFSQCGWICQDFITTYTIIKVLSGSETHQEGPSCPLEGLSAKMKQNTYYVVLPNKPESFQYVIESCISLRVLVMVYISMCICRFLKRACHVERGIHKHVSYQ